MINKISVIFIIIAYIFGLYINLFFDNLMPRIGGLIAVNTMLILLMHKHEKKT